MTFVVSKRVRKKQLSHCAADLREMLYRMMGALSATRKLSRNGLGGDQSRSPRSRLRDNVVGVRLKSENVTSGWLVVQTESCLVLGTTGECTHLTCKNAPRHAIRVDVGMVVLVPAAAAGMDAEDYN